MNFILFSLLYWEFQEFGFLKISSKPSKVEIAGFKHTLAVAQVSDSVNSFPPQLNIYAIGQSRIGLIHSISSPCYSLGTSLASFQHGFYATAPASAFRWGEPSPLIYRIITPNYTMIRLSEHALTPYGETFATSKKGTFQILCSPYSSKDCIILNKGQVRKINSTKTVDLFGQGIGISTNGSSFVIVSRKQANRNANIDFYSNYGISPYLNVKDNISIISSFEISYKNSMTSRSTSPIIQYINDVIVVIAFPDINKLIVFRYNFTKWIIKKSIDVEFTSMTYINQRIYIVTKIGRIYSFDIASFNQREEFDLQQKISNGAFTKIASGKDWLAFLEDSPNSRLIHVYSCRTSPLLRGIIIFAIFATAAFLFIALRENTNIPRLMKKITRKSNASKWV